jgi:uroporphyrinogen-III synthase
MPRLRHDGTTLSRARRAPADCKQDEARSGTLVWQRLGQEQASMHETVFNQFCAAQPRRLRGRRIAIPAHRELDRLSMMLRKEGARVARFPRIDIIDVTDHAAVKAWLDALSAGCFDDVIFLSGEGVERLIDAADVSGIRERVLVSLSRIRKLTRGPKPAGALQRLGLTAELSSAASVPHLIESLRTCGLAGRHVGVQVFGDDPCVSLLTFLEEIGAHVHPVFPYRCAPACNVRELLVIVEAIGRGQIDGVTFSAALEVSRLFEVARSRGVEATLRAGLARAQVAATNPIVAGCLQDLGVRVDIVPPRQFFLRRLTEAYCQRFSRGPTISAGISLDELGKVKKNVLP